MRMLAFIVLFGLLPQDPVKKVEPARPPEVRETLPPVQEPFRSAVERKDLLQRFTDPTPLEGLFQLERYHVPGRGDWLGSTGYLFFGRQHMHLYVQMPTGADKPPQMQASVRRYSLRGQQLLMTSLAGHKGGGGGKLKMERAGSTESRRVDLAGITLRLTKADGSYMEFVRIE